MVKKYIRLVTMKYGVSTQWRVVVVVTTGPRNFGRKGCEEIVDGQCDDDVVVDAHQCVHYDVSNTNPCNTQVKVTNQVRMGML